MLSEKLLKAREYESKAKADIFDEERPAFHLSPMTGWMNDPNGFCFYGGKYHMFYQYYPYEPHWNDMHWGHAVSSDMIKWEYLPAALANDEVYDGFGCFSGSAIGLDDGRHLLMYTGVRQEKDDNGKVVAEYQTQNLAIGDGVDYFKYENNPVIDTKDIPEGCSTTHFRDPKIWKAENGGYICAAANLAADGSGQILLYRSEDGFKWNYWKVLAANKWRYGKMWECPDFFKLGDKWVLITSPQDMVASGYEYINGNGTLCIIGSFDENSGEFIEESTQSIDYGIDFYAPQTVLTEDGRRIMIGWMQNWDALSIYGEDAKWACQMSIPRELSIKNGKLYQIPSKELENYRHGRCEYKGELISGKRRFDGISGRMVDMKISILPKENIYKNFEIRFAENDNFHTSLSFSPAEGILEIDRNYCGCRRAIISHRKSQVEDSKNGEITFRIILDRFSAEVFVNDGIKAVSTVIPTPIEADGISFIVDGEAQVDIVKYDIE